VWLENLAELAGTNRQGQVSSLPFDLAEAGIPFVVIATCEDGYREKLARKTFGDLMEHLTSVRLADISREDASHLVAKLGRRAEADHHSDQFDGTPGSIVLAVTSMRDEIYPTLPDLAKQALQAIKLLRSIGVRDYPIRRVIATARDVNGAVGSEDDWDGALSALSKSGFVNVQLVASTLTTTNDVYLDLAVPASPSGSSHVTEKWLHLQGSLEREQDWKPLARLGDAFRRQDDSSYAEACYRGALRGLTRANGPDEWALAQLGLGSILLEQIEMSPDSERSPFLEEARTAFDCVLSVVTPESDSFMWAETSAGLATLYRTEAATGLEALLRQGGPTTRQRKKRGQALEIALADSRGALKILRKETSPEEWAEAEYQLGLVHYVTAQLAWDARDRRTKLDTAIEAHERALTVFTEGENATKVARVQRAMGDACKLRAEVSIRPRKDEMLQRAISAYNHAVGISTARQVWSADETAGIRTNLGSCLRALALLSEEPRRSELLEKAATEFRGASHEYDLETSFVSRAEALLDLGNTLCEMALQSAAEQQSELWNESLVAFTDGLTALGRRGPNALRAQLHLGLATVYWQRAAHATPPPPVDVVQAFGNAQRALNLLPPDASAAQFNQTRKIIRDAERKARDSKIALPGQGDSSSLRHQHDAS
jgi:tetratricopeptide (TPR) repeat protein